MQEYLLEMSSRLVVVIFAMIIPATILTMALRGMKEKEKKYKDTEKGKGTKFDKYI